MLVQLLLHMLEVRTAEIRTLVTPAWSVGRLANYLQRHDVNIERLRKITIAVQRGIARSKEA